MPSLISHRRWCDSGSAEGGEVLALLVEQETMNLKSDLTKPWHTLSSMEIRRPLKVPSPILSPDTHQSLKAVPAAGLGAAEEREPSLTKIFQCFTTDISNFTSGLGFLPAEVSRHASMQRHVGLMFSQQWTLIWRPRTLHLVHSVPQACMRLVCSRQERESSPGALQPTAGPFDITLSS